MLFFVFSVIIAIIATIRAGLISQKIILRLLNTTVIAGKAFMDFTCMDFSFNIPLKDGLRDEMLRMSWGATACHKKSTEKGECCTSRHITVQLIFVFSA